MTPEYSFSYPKFLLFAGEDTFSNCCLENPFEKATFVMSLKRGIYIQKAFSFSLPENLDNSIVTRE